MDGFYDVSDKIHEAGLSLQVVFEKSVRGGSCLDPVLSGLDRHEHSPIHLGKFFDEEAPFDLLPVCRSGHPVIGVSLHGLRDRSSR